MAVCKHYLTQVQPSSTSKYRQNCWLQGGSEALQSPGNLQQTPQRHSSPAPLTTPVPLASSPLISQASSEVSLSPETESESSACQKRTRQPQHQLDELIPNFESLDPEVRIGTVALTKPRLDTIEEQAKDVVAAVGSSVMHVNECLTTMEESREQRMFAAVFLLNLIFMLCVM